MIQFLQEQKKFYEVYHTTQDFWTGYWDGLEGLNFVEEELTLNNLTGDRLKRYLDGYVQGSIEKQEEPTIDIPEWMTLQQVEAIKKLYFRNPDGSRNRASFFLRFQPYMDGYCGAGWCGMFIGIEKDGYSHS